MRQDIHLQEGDMLQWTPVGEAGEVIYTADTSGNIKLYRSIEVWNIIVWKMKNTKTQRASTQAKRANKSVVYATESDMGSYLA